MTTRTIDLDIFGLSWQETEQAPLHAAARQLANWLTVASGIQANIQLTLAKDVAIDDVSAKRPCVIIISLGNEVTGNEIVFPDLANKCREKCSALTSWTNQPVFVCTVFRHVPLQSYPLAKRSRAWLQERIRRINLLTAELSQVMGVSVIDIDRIFAHFGARLLQTDYLISEPWATEVAGDVIAGALLSDGLDHLGFPEWLEHARHLHGGLSGITERIKGTLSRSDSFGEGRAAI